MYKQTIRTLNIVCESITIVNLRGTAYCEPDVTKHWVSRTRTKVQQTLYKYIELSSSFTTQFSKQKVGHFLLKEQ